MPFYSTQSLLFNTESKIPLQKLLKHFLRGPKESGDFQRGVHLVFWGK